mgnify:CR=1 FL=1
MPRSVPSLYTLLAATVLSLGVVPSTVAQDPARTVSDAVPLAPDGEVTVDTHEGTITVTTWERNRVRYEAEVMPTDEDPDAEKVTIRARSGDDRLRLATDHEDGDDESTVFGFDEDGFRWGGINIPAVHYILTVPRGATLRIDDHESTIDVTGLAGTLHVDTHDGRLSVDEHRGDLILEAHDGTMTASGLEGDATLDTHGSRMELVDVTGRLSVETHDGTLNAEGLDGGLRFESHDGRASVAFSDLSGSVFAETHDGNLTLTLPAGAGFVLDTEFTDDVDLRSDIDLRSLRLSDEDEKGPNYRGSVRGGGPTIQLESSDGDVTLQTR